ncbi:methyltransferase domain-containing protein [Aquimarina sp. W85]|uniref:methyltransferase domain-containing protein n=1 Tax=Aquimarina rhodophyticola TaxID=3342246 RepID=UPI00366F48CF
MLVNTTHRSTQEEIMDSFDLQGPELRKTLKDLAIINSWLGGISITVDGVLALLKEKPKQKRYTIIDMGCGDGHILRALAILGKKKGYVFDLIGIDGNAHTIDFAKSSSLKYPEIKFYTQDFLAKFDSQDQDCDIVICTLTLHHFKKNELIELVNKFINRSRIGLVINDLHRSRIAYYLFKILCLFVIKNPIAQKDGAISILRGFKREDLKTYAAKTNQVTHKIKWCWAFRYQWILIKG